jgi:uncharacterized protein
MPAFIVSFAAGLVFGIGLIVSQMINPAKVRAFLDIAGNWDPSLAFVMGGAVAVAAAGHVIAKRLGHPVWGDRFHLPSRRDIDAPLVTGAVIFGVGWGLAGFCPGPAIVALPVGRWEVFLFVAAMVAGMAIYRLIPMPKPA